MSVRIVQELSIAFKNSEKLSKVDKSMIQINVLNEYLFSQAKSLNFSKSLFGQNRLQIGIFLNSTN